MDRTDSPIGILDSGVGGISTLQEMIRELPQEQFLYYGDTRNAPYGTKSREEVVACVRAAVAHLQEKRIKALVLACNTATGVAAAILRAELTIPVIGMEPALKPASEQRKGGAILVMATPLTLQSEKFSLLMDRYGEGAQRVPCPGLMEKVEAEDAAGCRQYLQELFARYPLDRVNAVVLGCTHYVFLKEMIRELLPDHILLTDGNLGTARQLHRVLDRNGLTRREGPGSVTLETSGSGADLALMRRFLDRPFPEAAGRGCTA